jgi:hypothetical protein
MLKAVRVLENYQWCGEPCFAGATTLLDGHYGYLPKIPRRRAVT